MCRWRASLPRYLQQFVREGCMHGDCPLKPGWLALYDRQQRNVKRGSHRKLPEAGERAIDAGFEPQRRPTTSQRAIAARKGRREICRSERTDGQAFSRVARWLV